MQPALVGAAGPPRAWLVVSDRMDSRRRKVLARCYLLAAAAVAAATSRTAPSLHGVLTAAVTADTSIAVDRSRIQQPVTAAAVTATARVTGRERPIPTELA